MHTIQSVIIETAAIENPFKKGTVVARCNELGVSCSQSAFESTTAEMGCTKPKRGWYLLPTGTQTAIPFEETTTTETVNETVNETVTEQPVVESTNRWVPTLDQTDHELFQEDLDDGYLSLKDIALMSNRCFGKYYPDNTCNSCPLAGSCQQATYAKIAMWADDLMDQLKEPVVEETQEVEEAKEVEETPKHTGTTTKVGFATICSKCVKVIEANTEFVNVENFGNVHIGCMGGE